MHDRSPMKRMLLAGLLVVVLAACTPPETEGGTPIPGAQSGAPLNDEAVGPSDEQEPAEEYEP
jgi:hypothetical protein